VPLYAVGLAAKDGLRAAGILKTRQLKWPVVSVGSLSAGGAGKTPVVIALAELLHARGWVVDVLSRGYGRGGTAVEQVQHDAEAAAAQYGDEPVLIAQRTGLPVWVASERFTAGDAAESKAGSSAHAMRVHLLDDGFQHRQLVRTVNIVLITAADLADSLLPAGNLREPLSAIRRADIVIVREDERERVLPQLNKRLQDAAEIWTTRRSLSFPTAKPAASSTETYAYLAFCAIARPENFLRDLKEANLSVIDAVLFPDHHGYMTADVEKIIAAFDRSAAKSFVTTEKDMVKLSQTIRERLESRGPIVVVRLETRFLEENKVMRDLEERLK
jgi:tetraacyldisaccharide 4'-kinase